MQISLFSTVLLATASVVASSPTPSDGDTALTIYNADFAVVRRGLTLELEAGENEVSVKGVTARLEPDSVLLRDPDGTREFRVLEQNYRSDAVSQELLLSLYEGQTIPFEVRFSDGVRRVQGRIVRSGYAPGGRHTTYSTRTPIIEVDGELRFGLPGVPLFPALADDTVLEPTLHWILEAAEAGPLEAELGYLTGGLSWKADYNLVLPEEGEVADITGWVTMTNESGRTFEDARVKLMAGDVNKISEPRNAGYAGARLRMAVAEPELVTEAALEDFHLYTLGRRTTLRDLETKQVEFVRAAGVQTRRRYVYDGAGIDFRQYRNWSTENFRNQRVLGDPGNTKVAVVREFRNSEANGLGIPLPKGRLRFYRRTADGQLEFTGENTIDHTPKDETIEVVTGNAFDIVGERVQTGYRVDNRSNRLEEAMRITIRNHKQEAVTVEVVELMLRSMTWEITAASHPWTKADFRRVEFHVDVPADGEVQIEFDVLYTW